MHLQCFFTALPTKLTLGNINEKSW